MHAHEKQCETLRKLAADPMLVLRNVGAAQRHMENAADIIDHLERCLKIATSGKKQ